MRSSSSSADIVAPFLGFLAAAAFLIAVVLMSADPVFAAEPPCDCSERPGNASTVTPEAGAPLFDEHDRRAVYQAIHLALSEVGDGASYVWNRSHGRLGGLVQINGSFKSPDGRLCRRMIVMLTAGRETKQIATSACRLADRSWELAKS
jgi:surface antigen